MANQVWYCPFPTTAITAAQDIFEIIAATGKPIMLRGVVLGQHDTDNEQFRCTIKRATGSYTSGSGGSGITPVRAGLGGSVGFTVEGGNTTRAAAGTGALTTLLDEPWPSQGGWQFRPTPEEIIECGGGEAIVVGFEVAPGASTNFSGYAIVEEVG